MDIHTFTGGSNAGGGWINTPFTGGSNAGGGWINTPSPEAAMPEVDG